MLPPPGRGSWRRFDVPWGRLSNASVYHCAAAPGKRRATVETTCRALIAALRAAYQYDRAGNAEPPNVLTRKLQREEAEQCVVTPLRPLPYRLFKEPVGRPGDEPAGDALDTKVACRLEVQFVGNPLGERSGVRIRPGQSRHEARGEQSDNESSHLWSLHGGGWGLLSDLVYGIKRCMLRPRFRLCT